MRGWVGGSSAYTPLAQWSGEGQESGGAQPVLPDKVQHFHTLCPLEDLGGDAGDQPSVALGGLRTLLLKGISSHDGLAYVLRRIDNKQVGS